jgi:hypothetical protein
MSEAKTLLDAGRALTGGVPEAQETPPATASTGFPMLDEAIARLRSAEAARDPIARRVALQYLRLAWEDLGVILRTRLLADDGTALDALDRYVRGWPTASIDRHT